MSNIALFAQTVCDFQLPAYNAAKADFSREAFEESNGTVWAGKQQKFKLTTTKLENHPDQIHT